MPKKPISISQAEAQKRTRPAMSVEAREGQMIALAVDLAEKQLMEGTASSQVICHYLKLATTRERIEKEILEEQKKMITAKTQTIKSQQRSEELMQDALRAFREYNNGGSDPDIY